MKTKPAKGRRPDRAEQLATVAAELFRARGFAEVPVTDIAAAAGVTGPALYRHFADKQAILAHVMLAGLDELIAVTHLDDGSTPEGVDAALERLAKLAVERRDATALWRSEVHNLDSDTQRLIGKRSGELIADWARVLRKLRPELDAGDAEVLCWAALSVFGSVAVHNTRIGKRRYAELLVGQARTVLHASLPDRSSATASAPEPVLQPSRREQLISAAGQLFGERGFYDVSIGDIGAAVGIAGPSVYKHFPSKVALFMAAANRIAERLELGRARVSVDASTEAEALSGLIRSYVETMHSSAAMFSFRGQLTVLPAADRAELRRVQRDYVAEWVRLLCGVRPELSTAEARVLVHMALTIANDLLRTRRVRARPRIDEDIVTLMSAVLGLDGCDTP